MIIERPEDQRLWCPPLRFLNSMQMCNLHRINLLFHSVGKDILKRMQLFEEEIRTLIENHLQIPGNYLSNRNILHLYQRCAYILNEYREHGQ